MINILKNFLLFTGTDVCPMKSVVRRIGQQLFTALSSKGMAMLVNHGIAEEKVSPQRLLYCTSSSFLHLYAIPNSALPIL